MIGIPRKQSRDFKGSLVEPSLAWIIATTLGLLFKVRLLRGMIVKI